MVLQNLLELSLSQSRQQQKSETELLSKADSVEIAEPMQRLSESLYRDLGSFSPVRKSSAKFADGSLASGEPAVVRLRQGMSQFADSVEIMGGTMLRLNQARCEAEKRIVALESVRAECVSRATMRDGLDALVRELKESVNGFCKRMSHRRRVGRRSRKRRYRS